MGLPIGQLDFKSNTGFSRKLSIVRDPSEDRQAGNQKAGEPWGLGVALTLSRKQDSPSSRPWVGGTLRWCTCFCFKKPRPSQFVWVPLAVTRGRSPSDSLGGVPAEAPLSPLLAPGFYLPPRVQAYLSPAQEGALEDRAEEHWLSAWPASALGG